MTCHDRDVMNRVVAKIVEIDGGEMRPTPATSTSTSRRARSRRRGARATPATDPLLLTGVVFGKLGARPEPIAFYRELKAAPAFRAPRRWRDLDPAAFAGLFLPGGHAPGMKQYLGSEELHRWIARFWRTAGRSPRSATARSRSPAPATSTAARCSTIAAPPACPGTWSVRHISSGSGSSGRYYRTYPAYVDDEVRAALADSAQLAIGPRTYTARGTRDDDGPAFVVEDGAYVSARWPGDAY